MDHQPKIDSVKEAIMKRLGDKEFLKSLLAELREQEKKLQAEGEELDSSEGYVVTALLQLIEIAEGRLSVDKDPDLYPEQEKEVVAQYVADLDRKKAEAEQEK